jgi:protein phosphatase
MIQPDRPIAEKMGMLKDKLAESERKKQDEAEEKRKKLREKLEVIKGGKKEKRAEKEKAKEKIAIGVDTLQNLREHLTNEDAYIMNPERGFAAVLDGMGGEKAGGVASKEAAKVFEENLLEINEDASLDENIDGMEKAILAANEHLVTMSDADPEKYSDMGTTLSAIKLYEGPEGRKAIIGNVGDSRIYRIRSGKMESITEDDSVVEFLVRSGVFKNDQDLDQELPERYRSHPSMVETFGKDIKTLGDIRRGVTKKVGIRELILNDPDELKQGKQQNIFAIDTRPGDRFIISSDGIHDVLTDSEIETIGSKPKSVADIARELADESQRTYSKTYKENLAKLQAASTDEEREQVKIDKRAKDDDRTVQVIDVPKPELKELLPDLIDELKNQIPEKKAG